MNITIVGQKNGQKVVCWMRAAVLAIALAVIAAAGMALTYRILSGNWSTLIPLFGIFGAIAMVAVGIMAGLQTPISRLQNLR